MPGHRFTTAVAFLKEIQYLLANHFLIFNSIYDLLRGELVQISFHFLAWLLSIHVH